MVSFQTAIHSLVSVVLLLEEKTTQAGIQKLDPATRVKVIAVFVGLIILGIAMILLTWMGARAVRRYANREPLIRRRSSQSSAQADDWADKPLNRVEIEEQAAEETDRKEIGGEDVADD